MQIHTLHTEVKSLKEQQKLEKERENEEKQKKREEEAQAKEKEKEKKEKEKSPTQSAVDLTGLSELQSPEKMAGSNVRPHAHPSQEEKNIEDTKQFSEKDKKGPKK